MIIANGIPNGIRYMVDPDTGEKALCVWMRNSDGAAHPKGTIVNASTAADESVMISPIDSDMPMAVAFEQVNAGSFGWYAVSGIALVRFAAGHTATRGWMAYCSSTAGLATSANVVPAAATHDREIGHVMKTAGGAGQSTLVNLHWR